MSNYLLFKSMTANAAIAAYRIVKLVAAETVAPAASAADNSIGAVGHISPAMGERCDVALTGIAYIEAGAVIALGAMVTSDGVGRCVTAAPAAGSNVRLIGMALEAATAVGDLIRVQLQVGVMQG